MKHLWIIFILIFIGVLPVTIYAENSAKDAANLYKKGLYAMKNNQCETAKKYFSQAIKIIPRDNRNLRTFGRNTSKYFPNKRLKRLRTQCKSVVTSKPTPLKVVAKVIPKTTPPIVKPIKIIPLSIKLNKPKINHRKGTAIISGTMTGHSNSRLTLNSAPVRLKNNRFSSQIKIPYGRSTAKLALKYQQQKIERRIKIKRNRPKPKIKPLSIAVLSPNQDKTSTFQNKIEVKIKIQGNSKALVVTINGQKSAQKNKIFTQIVDLRKGKNTITIKAKNKYQTIREKYQIYRKTPLVLTLKSKKLMNIAGKITVIGKIEADDGFELLINGKKVTAKSGSFKYQMKIRKRQKNIEIKAISGEQEIAKNIQVIADNNALKLTIEQPQNKFQTRENTVNISGHLTGGSKPKLTMNNTPLKLKNQYFDYTVSLNTGDNIFKFKVVDKAGRKITQNLIVEKVKPLKIIIAQGDYIVSKAKNITLTGRIDGILGQANLSIDNNIISLQADGTFKYQVSSASPIERKVQIVVSDDSQQMVKKTIRIIAE